MASFKKFMVVWCATIIAVSAFAVGAGTLPNRPSTIMEKERAHFSVHWMGFIPDYSDQYPEYYACINDLLSDTLYFPIALKLVNQENSSLYFRIVQNQTPPSGWTLPVSEYGLISKDETRFLTYNTFRDKPASIPEGRLTETISLAVQAYYDSLYTQFYSQDSFTVTYNLLDRTAVVWTVLDTDNFDDGSAHEWTGGNGAGVSGELYRSFPYSFKAWHDWGGYGSYGSKSFNISVVYSEAYLILAIKSPGGTPISSIAIDGVTCFIPDVSPAAGVWNQIAMPIPIGQVSTLTIAGHWAPINLFFEDVYIIAK